MSDSYLAPPHLTDAEGKPRRAGFEFEFGNLPIAKTGAALQQALGGELEQISPFEAVIHGTELGRLKVERDADVLKSTRYRKWLENLGIEFTPGTLAHGIETNIDSATRGLIPCEVVTDPIPFSNLEILDKLVQTLDSLGAEGTQQSLIYAFGLHINPSLPDQTPATICRYIQAFLLMHAWLVEIAGTDRTRRYLTPYIDAFPQGYSDWVLRPDYRPDQRQLIADYLEFNPTRNRALDMLPIFAHLDRDAVLAGLPEDERRLVSARPAFHYRLPDCKVNVPGWSVAQPWNRWIYIEKLAGDEALLAKLIAAWQAHSAEIKLAKTSRWVMLFTSLVSEQFFTAQ